MFKINLSKSVPAAAKRQRAAAKSRLLARAKALGVEVDFESPDAWGDRHVHAYAPAQMRFRSTNTHDICLSDGGRVDWLALQHEIELIPCDKASCEVDCWDAHLGGDKPASNN